MDFGASGPGCAAALHGVSSGFQTDGQAEDASGDAARGTEDRAGDGAALCVRGKYSWGRREYGVPGVRDDADQEVMARRDGEPAAEREVPEVRAGDSGSVGKGRNDFEAEWRRRSGEEV